MAPTAPATLRVLCLHGFRTNARVMRDQVRALRRALGPRTEFVFLDGPYEADGPAFPDIEAHYADAKPFFEWMQFTPVDDPDTTLVMSPEATRRMRAQVGDGDEWFLRFKGLRAALGRLEQQLDALGPFDVAVGFSQGGLVLTVLAMWLLQQRQKRLWRLSVLVSACRVNAVNFKHLFVTPDGRDLRVPFPSVHVTGAQDPVRAESRKLVDMYDAHPSGCPTARLVLQHGEGHRFPSAKRHEPLYAALAAAMNAYRREDRVLQTTPPSKL